MFIGAGRNDPSSPPRNDSSSPPAGYILPPRNDGSSKENSLKEDRKEASFSHSLPKEIRERLGLPPKAPKNEASEDEVNRQRLHEQIQALKAMQK